ncbi:FecR family protein [Oceanobacter mangrovi]|uniref:FecR family protein n=1 Tax=Oceanobacter mangrovi TaxID=2862510 RepID=UPI001C8E86D5|nr:FecR domain-containing protein [Oceanobacter mangrovi]
MTDQHSQLSLDDQAFSLIRRFYEAESTEAAAQLQQQLEQWQQQSTEHRQALAQASEDWLLMGQLSDVASPTYQSAKQPANKAHTCTVAKPRSNWLGAGAALAAISCLAIVACLTLWQQPTSSLQTASASSAANWQQQFRSGYGEVQQHTLPDGSQVTLNWDSEIAIDFSAEQRNVRLLHGEAFFQVAHNPARPFVVQANGARARAVGTAFNVRQQDDEQVTIAVTEGVVAVTGDKRQSLVLNASQQVAVLQGVPGAVQSQPAQRTLAWQTGSLIFDQQPLVEVLAEINRYTRYQIDTRYLPSPQAPVTATYFISRTDEAIRSLMQLFQLQADMRQQADGNHLVLRPALRKPSQ